MKNENITYACMENSKNFHHNYARKNYPNANDFKYWIKVFIKNINFVFYAFKPFNYECLLVITSNLNFLKVLKKNK